MSTVGRLAGIILHPAETALAIKEKPSWLLAFVLAAVLVALVAYVTYPIVARDQAQTFGESFWAKMMPEEQLRQTEERMWDEVENPSLAGRVRGMVSGIAVLLLVQMLLYGAVLNVIAKLMGGAGTWRGVLGVIAHGRLIMPGIESLARLPLVLAKKTMVGVSLGLGALFTNLEPGSMAYMLLDMFNIFGIWFLIVVVVGLEKVHGLSRSKAIVAALVPWVLGGVIWAAFLSAAM